LKSTKTLNYPIEFIHVSLESTTNKSINQSLNHSKLGRFEIEGGWGDFSHLKKKKKNSHGLLQNFTIVKHTSQNLLEESS
jgi:hypothetical protein